MFKLMLPLLMLVTASPIAKAEPISFLTEEYPPFNYRDGSDIKGATVDQVRSLMAGIADYTIDIVPWARAYAQARNTPMSCVFVTAHTLDRDPLFKWVEPLLIDRNLLIKHKGTSVTATTIEEAKQYSVGTWRDDYTETLLRKLNFPRIDIANNMTAAFKKLTNDRIDLMPMSELYYNKLVKQGEPFEKVVVLSEQPMGIACQRDFPEDLLRKMQTALDGLISDGRQQAIFQQYGMQLQN